MILLELRMLYNFKWENNCEGLTGKDVENIGCGLFYCTIVALVWKELGGHREA